MILFFISGSKSFLDVMILLFIKMSQEKKKTIHKAISSFYFRVWSADRMQEGKFVGMAII